MATGTGTGIGIWTSSDATPDRFDPDPATKDSEINLAELTSVKDDSESHNVPSLLVVHDDPQK